MESSGKARDPRVRGDRTASRVLTANLRKGPQERVPMPNLLKGGLSLRRALMLNLGILRVSLLKTGGI